MFKALGIVNMFGVTLGILSVELPFVKASFVLKLSASLNINVFGYSDNT